MGTVGRAYREAQNKARKEICLLLYCTLLNNDGESLETKRMNI